MKDAMSEMYDSQAFGTDKSSAGHIGREAEEPWDVSFEGKTVVVGLGNPYMRDDGIGIQAARSLRGKNLGDRVFIYETQGMELSLLWQFKGARKIVVLDALKSGQRPGTVTRHTVVPDENQASRLPNLHALQLYDLFDLATGAELLPCPVVIIGVEPEDCSPGEGLTGRLADALPMVVKAAIKELGAGDPDHH